MAINIQIVQDNGWDVINYSGPIDADAEVHLAQLPGKLGKKCIFNFREVEFVNSCGVRGWINFMRELEKDREIVFTECTNEIVMQMNMIPSFKGTAQVNSVYATYSCDSCGHNANQLFEKGKNLPSSPEDDLDQVKCPKCGEEMDMEELEEEFFAFLAA